MVSFEWKELDPNAEVESVSDWCECPEGWNNATLVVAEGSVSIVHRDCDGIVGSEYPEDIYIEVPVKVYLEPPMAPDDGPDLIVELRTEE